jgi:hypothetical protein
VFEISHFSRGQNGVLKMEQGYLAMLPPLHDEMPELVSTRRDAPTPECSYYFNGIIITDTRSNRIIGPLHLAQIASDDPWFFRFHKRDRLYYIQWNRETLDSMIRWAAGAV